MTDTEKLKAAWATIREQQRAMDEMRDEIADLHEVIQAQRREILQLAADRNPTFNQRAAMARER